MKQIKAIVTSKIKSESATFEIESKEFKYDTEILLTEQEYTELYSETILDPNTGLAKNVFNVEVLSIDEVEEPKNDEEVKLEATEDIIIEQVELFNAIQSNVKSSAAAAVIYVEVCRKIQEKENESESEPS